MLGFNTKAIAVALTHLLRLHLQTNENENLPGGAAFKALGAFGGSVGATDRHLRGALLLTTLTTEGMVGAIAFAPTTQRACTTSFPPNGARNNGWNPLFIKVVLHINPRKPPIQQQMLALNFQSSDILHQTLHDDHGGAPALHNMATDV